MRHAQRLMGRFLLLLAGWCLAWVAQAADVQLGANVKWPLSLADHARITERADPALNLDDVLRLEGQPGSFQSLAGRPLRLTDVPYVAWLRLGLHNAEPVPQTLRLVLGDTRVQRVDFYVLHDSAVAHSVTGSGIALARQQWSDRNAGVELTLPEDGRAIVYARIQNTHPAGLTPKLYSAAAYAKREQRAALWDGALLGGLMALGWSAFIIAIFSRSRVFLWLALLCLVVTLFESTYRGYSQLYLWPQATVWGHRAVSVLEPATAVFFALFVLGVARHENIRLPLRRVFIFMAGGKGLLAVLAAAGVPYPTAWISFYWTAIFYALGLVMALYLMHRTTPSGRLMAVVMGFALVNFMLRKAHALGLDPWLSLPVSLDIHPNPVVALVGLATNLAVLAAWIHQLAVQRQAAHTKLVDWQRQEQESLRREVERQTQALSEALAYAQEKGRQQVQMLGYITHDLRAPLATIAGYARILEQSSTPVQHHHVRSIERSIKYQLALIDDLLEFTRAELHPLRIAPGKTDLLVLLHDISDYAATLAAGRGNHYMLDRRTELPACVELDARRLQQVLLNLISNAAKYTHDGSIRLQVDARPAEAGWLLRFAVADTGIGICLPQQTSVFEAFKQIQSAHGGVGLGLFIAQRIVDGMGGRLQVQSAVGRGSVFSFEIMAASAGARMVAAGCLSGQPDMTRARPDEPGIIAPAHLRAGLAVLARDGRLSDIEAWLATHVEERPQYQPFYDKVANLLQLLDFESIERLALEAHE